MMMLMKRNMVGTRHPNVRLNDKRIKYVKCAKYLGVWVSETMSFKLHLESLRKKSLNVVGKLRRVLKSEWGLRKRAMRVIYKGLLAASMMYGASGIA